MTKLSVIIITKNEVDNIRACLESVAWADEIIVVDSGSSDGTVDICKAMGAQVHTTADWPGFGIQKNRALSPMSLLLTATPESIMSFLGCDALRVPWQTADFPRTASNLGPRPRRAQPSPRPNIEVDRAAGSGIMTS